MAARPNSKAAVAMMGTNVLQRFATLVNFLILPRLLSVSAYGALGTAITVSAVMGVVADLGVQVATVRSLARAIEEKRETGAIIGAALIVRAALGCAAFCVAVIFTVAVPLPASIRLMTLIAVGALLSPLTNVYSAVLQAHLAVWRLALVTLGTAIISTAVSLGLAGAGDGALSVVIAYNCVIVAAGVAYFGAGRRYGRITFRGAQLRIGEITRSAWQLGLGALIFNVYYRIDTLMLAAITGATAVGIYYTAYRLAETVYQLTVVVVAAGFPIISRAHFADRQQAVLLARTMLRLIAVVGVVVATIGPMLSRFCVSVLYGPRYSGSGPMLALLQIGTPLMALTLAICQAAAAFGTSRLILRASIVGLVVTIGLDCALVPAFGAMGATVATVVTDVAVAAAVAPWIISALGVDRGRIIRGSICCTLAAIVSTAGAAFLSPVASAFAGMILALAASRTSGLVDRAFLEQTRRLCSLEFWRSRDGASQNWAPAAKSLSSS